MQKMIADRGFICGCGERVFSGERAYTNTVEETSVKTKKVKFVKVRYCRFCGENSIRENEENADSEYFSIEQRSERERELFGAYLANRNPSQYFEDNC